MKKRLKLWWFTKVVVPQIMKWKNEAIYLMVPQIVEQLFMAGVNPGQINKWLNNMDHKTIKGYMREGNGRYRIFYTWPSAERRAELEGTIKRVI